MIQFEDITTLFDVNFDALEKHVRHLELTIPKAGGQMFNGWTVMGRNGLHTDAWIDGSQFVKKRPNGKVFFDYLAAKSAGFYPNKAHNRFTNAASDELVKLLDRAKELGLKPCRARLTQLVPGASSGWHSDSPPETLILRLHVVVESNPQAVFRTDQGSTHLPAGRIFLINVNDYHAVENFGASPRTHLVTDVEDSLGLSKVHRQ